MFVSPVPIIALLFSAQAVVVAILVMPFPDPHTVRANLSTIPGVVIRVIFVVVPRVRGASACQQRRNHRSAQDQGPKKSLYSEHCAILLRIRSFSSPTFADDTAIRVKSLRNYRSLVVSYS